MREPLNPGTPVIRNRSLSEEVADALRDMILTGQLRPEDALTQDDLASRLGVSAMPVREALLKLAHEGLVEARRNRSFQVVRTRREDIADLYWAHAVLAGELSARAAERSGPELVKTLRELDGAWAEADTATLERLNFRFHRAINVAADAPKLLVLLRTTLRGIPEHFYALVPQWRESARRDHRRVIKAVAGADPEAARAAAQRHVQEAGKLLIAYFDDQGYWTRPS